jgi:ubiquinone/menaquinone biosynthesis C-methylase UbiE
MEDTEYDLMARVEDRLWWYRALHANVARALARHTPADGRPVLDAGCGTGGTVIRVSPALLGGRTFVGLDYHPLACAYTRERTGIPVVSGTVTATFLVQTDADNTPAPYPITLRVYGVQ